MRIQSKQIIRRGFGFAAAFAAGVLVAFAPGSAMAHEGHAALPSTGAVVEGNQVLVSEAARTGLGLQTATVVLQDLSRVLRVRAHVELPWEGQAMVTTLVPGRVQSIRVKPGETVEAGEELARIESLELGTLQLTMLQAAEEVALAQRLVEQRRSLAQSGAIAAKSLLETETQLRQKQAQLAIAERKLLALGVSHEILQEVRTSGRQVSSISVTSPIDGVVVHADVRVGQSVDTEQHLFNIVDGSRVLLVGEVLETDAWQVQPGQSVAASFPALTEHSFTGWIDRLRLSVRPDERTLEVTAPVDNPEGALRPGMSGRMEITVYRAQEAIVCPTSALINAPGRIFVLLRRGEGKFERREIKVGLQTPEQVEVLDGLFPGDRVVVTGTKLLASMFHTDQRVAADDEPGSPRTSDAAPTQAREPSIPVAQAVVELPTSGKAFATPVVEGRIAAIHTQPGETVEAGEVLAELDSQELRSLQLELLGTQETLRRVDEMLDRVQTLASSGDYPQTQLWELQVQQKNAQMALQTIEQKLAVVGLSPETIDQLRGMELSSSARDVAFVTAPVRAPIGGRVADFMVVPGQVVHANDAVFEIQDLSRMWIEGYVFEQHAAKIAVGQTAEIRVPAYPEMELSGTLVRAAPTLHATSRVLPVWIEVENPEQKLREGMLAKVEIPSGPTRQVAASASDQN